MSYFIAVPYSTKPTGYWVLGYTTDQTSFLWVRASANDRAVKILHYRKVEDAISMAKRLHEGGQACLPRKVGYLEIRETPNTLIADERSDFIVRKPKVPEPPAPTTTLESLFSD